MSGVDVLAVMDVFGADYKAYIPQFHAQNRKRMKGILAELDEARAAVAELIEAGTELQLANEDLTDRKTGNVGARLKRLHKAEARFADALSRVRGAE